MFMWGTYHSSSVHILSVRNDKVVLSLQRELEMSANHMDGGKLNLEQLLQFEVEQQQRLTNLRRDTLRNLAIKAYFDRPVSVQVIIACARGKKMYMILLNPLVRELKIGNPLWKQKEKEDVIIVGRISFFYLNPGYQVK